MSRSRTTIALVISGLLLGAGLAAHTGAGGGDPELALIANSADAITDAGSYRAEFSMSAEVAGIAGGAFSMEGEGEFDERQPAGRVTMRVAGAGEQLEMQVLFVETVFYINMGTLGEQIGTPTPWVSFDLASVPGMAELLGGGMGTTDPTQFLEYLRGAGGAEVVGPEQVRGVATTHYRATVDLEDAIRSAPENQRDALRQAMASFGTGTDLDAFEFPVEVWIDDEGLPRRTRMAFDLGGVGHGGEIPAGANMSFTMETFDFGTAVDIQPPPADQVTDMSNLIDLTR